jgi:hypothetical protein
MVLPEIYKELSYIPENVAFVAPLRKMDTTPSNRSRTEVYYLQGWAKQSGTQIFVMRKPASEPRPRLQLPWPKLFQGIPLGAGFGFDIKQRATLKVIRTP